MDSNIGSHQLTKVPDLLFFTRMFIYINSVRQNHVHGSSQFPIPSFVPEMTYERFLIKFEVLCDTL
jgi:hypothetical protein